MGKEKPLEQDATNSPSFSSHAADWLNAFKKHFSIAFQDAASNLPTNAANGDLQKAAVAAMTNTLRDSGLSDDQMLVFLAEAFENVRSEPIEWTPELNQRRVDLIDRDIANSISFDEKVELAQLTNALRGHRRIRCKMSFPPDYESYREWLRDEFRFHWARPSGAHE